MSWRGRWAAYRFWLHWWNRPRAYIQTQIQLNQDSCNVGLRYTTARHVFYNTKLDAHELEQLWATHHFTLGSHHFNMSNRIEKYFPKKETEYKEGNSRGNKVDDKKSEAARLKKSEEKNESKVTDDERRKQKGEKRKSDHSRESHNESKRQKRGNDYRNDATSSSYARQSQHTSPSYSRPQDRYHKEAEKGHSSSYKGPSSSSTGKKSPHKNVKKRPEEHLKDWGHLLTRKQKENEYQSILYQDKSHDTADDFEFFYGSNCPFSQHYICEFEVDENQFCCAEQYMMYMKAVVFKDFFHAEQILMQTDPRVMKKLGRKVRNFDPRVWTRESERIVKKGNKCKFSQNEGLKAVLFSTYPRIMVEASPRDRIWGIGLGRDRPQAWCRATWKGSNKLGYILTELRNELMMEDNLLVN